MQDEIRASLLKKSKAAKRELFGKIISGIAIALIIVVVAAIFLFVATKGIATFTTDKVNLWDFLSKTVWNPGNKGADGQPEVGALAMIVGSFLVTFLAAILSTPFAIAAAIYMTEISKKRGRKILQPVIELLVEFRLWFMVSSGCPLSCHLSKIFLWYGLRYSGRDVRLVRDDLANGDFDDG